MRAKKSLDEKELNKKREERTVAKAVKAEIFPLEKNNYSHLYVFKSTDGWYKMGGHSALFFKYRIAPRLKIKCELRTDRDFYYTFKDGIIPVKDPTTLEAKLKKLRVFKKGVELGYMVFDLLEVVSEDQIKEMRNFEKEKYREINKIIDPNVVLVKTLGMARMVQKDVFEQCRKLDEATRGLMGRDTVYLAIRIMDNILYTCKGHLKISKMKQQVKNDIVLLMTRITLMIDEKRIGLNDGVKILKNLDMLERIMLEECVVVEKNSV